MSEYKNMINNLSNAVKSTNVKTVSMYGGSFLIAILSLEFIRFSYHYLPNAVFYFLLSYLSMRVYETMNDNSVTDKFNNIMYTCSYDIIVLYSKTQIICKQIKENLNLYTNYEENIQKTIYKILNIPKKPTNTYTFEYIKNGDVINKTVSLNKHLLNEDTYDFIILSNESTKHKKIIQKEDVNSLNDCMEVDVDSIDMITSTVKFMVFQLSIPFLKKDDETLLDLHLKTANHNFLIDENRIDKKFLLHFVNHYYSDQILNIKHLNGCQVRFIDNEVKMIDMKLDEQYIHLYENTYEIKNIDTLDTRNNFVENEDEYFSHISREKSIESSIASSIESSSDE